MPVRRWHEIVASRDPAGLQEFLAEDAVFRSPAVHDAQEGRDAVARYLAAALVVLGPTLAYQSEWFNGRSAVLEFNARLDDGARVREIHGVDIIRWNDSDQVVEFTVMVRPLRALEALVHRMGKQLTH